jgi:hypothetical protein
MPSSSKQTLTVSDISTKVFKSFNNLFHDPSLVQTHVSWWSDIHETRNYATSCQFLL